MNPFTSNLHGTPFTSNLNGTPLRPTSHRTPFTSNLNGTPFTSNLHRTPFTSNLNGTPFTSNLNGTPFTSNLNGTPLRPTQPYITQSPEPPYLAQSRGSPYIQRQMDIGRLPYTHGERIDGSRPSHRPVYTFCPNSQNPWHTCSPYCRERYGQKSNIQRQMDIGRLPYTHGERIDGSRPSQRPVYTFCPNSQNPWHTCSPYCRERYGQKSNQLQTFKNQLSQMGYSYDNI